MTRRCDIPLYDLRCDVCHDAVEHYLPHADTPAPVCEKCGTQRKKCIGTFAVVGTGLLSTRYNDPKLEGAHMEGHWVRDIDPKTGKRTVPLFIETFQEQREYCKRNGFYNPGEIGQVEAHADGKSYSSRGLPGAW